MSERLATDLALMHSYVRQIEALCTVTIENLAGAGMREREEFPRVADLARVLGERLAALRRRHPLPRHTPAPPPESVSPDSNRARTGEGFEPEPTE